MRGCVLRYVMLCHEMICTFRIKNLSYSASSSSLSGSSFEAATTAINGTSTRWLPNDQIAQWSDRPMVRSPNDPNDQISWLDGGRG